MLRRCDSEVAVLSKESRLAVFLISRRRVRDAVSLAVDVSSMPLLFSLLDRLPSGNTRTACRCSVLPSVWSRVFVFAGPTFTDLVCELIAAIGKQEPLLVSVFKEYYERQARVVGIRVIGVS